MSKSRFPLRIPEKLRIWLNEEVEKNDTSLQKQIIRILEKEKALNTANVQGFNANTTTS